MYFKSCDEAQFSRGYTNKCKLWSFGEKNLIAINGFDKCQAVVFKSKDMDET